ncbi:MAG: Dihydrofolate reductase, partial [uncultured Blastococcus sp.]
DLGAGTRPRDRCRRRPPVAPARGPRALPRSHHRIHRRDGAPHLGVAARPVPPSAGPDQRGADHRPDLGGRRSPVRGVGRGGALRRRGRVGDRRRCGLRRVVAVRPPHRGDRRRPAGPGRHVRTTPGRRVAADLPDARGGLVDVRVGRSAVRGHGVRTGIGPSRWV